MALTREEPWGEALIFSSLIRRRQHGAPGIACGSRAAPPAGSHQQARTGAHEWLLSPAVLDLAARWAGMVAAAAVSAGAQCQRGMPIFER